MNADRRANVHTRRNNIVAALTHVDMIIGMHLRAEMLSRQTRDNFVSIHIGAGAGARLKHIDRKVLIILPFSYRHRGRLNRNRYVTFQEAELGIRASCRPFYEAECSNKLRRHRDPGDRKIINRTLRLRSPKCIFRDF